MVRLVTLCLFVFGFFLSSQFAMAEVLYEGYSKVLSGGVHIGFSIVRYDFNAKTKKFTATTFLKTNELGGNITESVKAEAAEDLAPLSYSYTALIGNQTKLIDAKFSKGRMIAQVKDGGKATRVTLDLPKGTFLSMFLSYVILKSPQGLKVDANYHYQAIAEEDATLQKGIALVKAQEEFNGFKSFKILNEFKSTKFISYINERGEVLSTKSPVQGISTELMSDPQLAVGKFQLPTALLKALFGDIPAGVTNEVSKKFPPSEKPVGQLPPPETTIKGGGIRGGKGILLKGGATSQPSSPTAPPTTESEGK